MKIDVHVYLHDDQRIMEKLEGLKEQIASFATRSGARERNIMTAISDIQTKAEAGLAAVQEETNLANAVKMVVDNQNVANAALKARIDELIAQGSTDPAELQKLSDTLDMLINTDVGNREIVAAAVVAGTPAA